jgi:hypothetical protein
MPSWRRSLNNKPSLHHCFVRAMCTLPCTNLLVWPCAPSQSFLGLLPDSQVSFRFHTTALLLRYRGVCISSASDCRPYGHNPTSSRSSAQNRGCCICSSNFSSARFVKPPGLCPSLHQLHLVECSNRRSRNDHLREFMQYLLHPGRSSASMLSSDPGQTCGTKPYLATSNSSCIIIVRQPSLFLCFLLPLRLISPFAGEPSFQPSRTREELCPIRH